MKIDKTTNMHNVHNKALELGFAGHKAKEVQAVTGLNHVQYDVARYVLNYYYVWNCASIPNTPEAVHAMRDLYGFSFGYIRIALGTNPETGQCLYSEGYVNRLYEQATGHEMHGTRNGRGGAYLAGEARLYSPEEHRVRTGTLLTKAEVAELRAGGSEATAAAMLRQSWLNLGREAMVAAAKEAGVQVARNATPAQLAIALAKAEVELP